MIVTVIELGSVPLYIYILLPDQASEYKRSNIRLDIVS